MGLFDFVKDAGEALFGGDEEKQPDPGVRTLEKARADKETSERLTQFVTSMSMGVESFEARYIDGTVTLKGKVASQADREKVVLLVGNTQGVGRVDDQMILEKPEPEATMYTVQSGDTLSKIAKAHYGNAGKYMAIFEANQPMLKNPDRIYPGQVLRIPTE
jgi:nucleoid-associated protein YgaU